MLSKLWSLMITTITPSIWKNLRSLSNKPMPLKIFPNKSSDPQSFAPESPWPVGNFFAPYPHEPPTSLTQNKCSWFPPPLTSLWPNLVNMPEKQSCFWALCLWKGGDETGGWGELRTNRIQVRKSGCRRQEKGRENKRKEGWERKKQRENES